jgi:hypothetical protein
MTFFNPRLFNSDDVTTWPWFRTPLIAHDVGRSRDRSTAVVGGHCTYGPRLLGIREFVELPQGLCGRDRAGALANIDRRYNNDAVIFVDLTFDPSYAEMLWETFGPRVIGLHISRHGDGTHCEWRRVKNGAIMVYTVGRSYLLELFHSELQARQIRFVDTPESRHAFKQLADLETELRETGVVYKCQPGKHDDLGMSCAMLAWAARHPHLSHWIRPIEDAHRPRRPRRDAYGWKSFV